MAQFAPVAPVAILGQLKAHGILGHYHLLLAHDVVEHPKEYAHLFDTKQDTLIMDNSLIELGHPCDTEMMRNALEITGAQYAVLPDYLERKNETLEASFMAMETWGNLGDTKYVGVVQGKTLEELKYCAEVYFGDHRFGGIFIPRIITKRLGTRMHITEAILDMVNNYGRYQMLIHLLGFSDNIIDDIACARWCDGIDTTVPIRMGLKGDVLPLELFKDTGPRGDYWEQKEINKTVVYNLQWIRKALAFNAQAESQTPQPTEA